MNAFYLSARLLIITHTASIGNVIIKPYTAIGSIIY